MSKVISIDDMMICTTTVTVTPTATAATMSKKNTAPTIVTAPLLFAADVEKSPRRFAPTGNVAATMKISAETMSAQPDM